MRRTLIALAVLGLYLPSLAFGAVSTSAIGPKAPTKTPGPAYVGPPPGTGVGGDNFGTAFPIGSLPFNDSGNTCGFANDYAPQCAMDSPTAPDVVYSFTPASNVCVNVSLCGSAYDTVLYIVDGATGLVVGCNDDFCSFQSALNNVSLTGGTTYFIVIDGFASSCGQYTLAVRECAAGCDLACNIGSVIENEPNCGDGYIDTYNGGCNSTPAVSSSVPCNDAGVSICGHYGTFVMVDQSQARDTDWYQIVLDHAVTLRVCGCAEGNFQIVIIDAGPGCPVADTAILGFATTFTPNEQICATATVGPGTYWIWAGAADFSGVTCGARYVLTVTGYECTPVGVEPASWGNIKALYR